jgi:hypothetical protein
LPKHFAAEPSFWRHESRITLPPLL